MRDHLTSKRMNVTIRPVARPVIAHGPHEVGSQVIHGLRQHRQVLSIRGGHVV